MELTFPSALTPDDIRLLQELPGELEQIARLIGRNQDFDEAREFVDAVLHPNLIKRGELVAADKASGFVNARLCVDTEVTEELTPDIEAETLGDDDQGPDALNLPRGIREIQQDQEYQVVVGREWIHTGPRTPLQAAFTLLQSDRRRGDWLRIHLKEILETLAQVFKQSRRKYLSSEGVPLETQDAILALLPDEVVETPESLGTRLKELAGELLQDLNRITDSRLRSSHAEEETSQQPIPSVGLTQAPVPSANIYAISDTESNKLAADKLLLDLARDLTPQQYRIVNFLLKQNGKRAFWTHLPTDCWGAGVCPGKGTANKAFDRLKGRLSELYSKYGFVLKTLPNDAIALETNARTDG